MKILTLNCWNHAVRYHLFSDSGQRLLAMGVVERVGLGGAYISQKVPGRKPVFLDVEFVDHHGAVDLVIATLTDSRHGVIPDMRQISAVGHRVAHGGEQFRHSVQVDRDLLSAMSKLEHLAPLHCAPNIAGIKAGMELLPHIPHVAIFDTAFHFTLPECAYIYPLPYEWYEKHRVRRYGFHGPSHLYISRRASVFLGKPVSTCNLITVHIDRGVSICALKNGLSIDTSMGMTPLEGAVMETRCGDIDPGIHSYMMRKMNLSVWEWEQILNQKSGIFGITGLSSGRQHLLEAALDGEPRAELALDIDTYRIKKYIGSYLAAVGPLDGIVFTAGAGPVEWFAREKIMHGLECMGVWLDPEKNRAARIGRDEAEITGKGSLIRTFVIPTNEELVYAEDAAAIQAGVYSDHQHHDYSFAHGSFTPVQMM